MLRKASPQFFATMEFANTALTYISYQIYDQYLESSRGILAPGICETVATWDPEAWTSQKSVTPTVTLLEMFFKLFAPKMPTRLDVIEEQSALFFRF